jgi:hypothetical protein
VLHAFHSSRSKIALRSGWPASQARYGRFSCFNARNMTILPSRLRLPPSLWSLYNIVTKNGGVLFKYGLFKRKSLRCKDLGK